MAENTEVQAPELREAWWVLTPAERAEAFEMMRRAEAEELFSQLSPLEQMQLVLALPRGERRLWLRLLEPDDAADVLQEAPLDEREQLLSLLDDPTRREVSALLAYAEDEAGGLMSPRYARVRPEMTVDEAIRYLRRQSRSSVETIYYAYVLDPQQRLLGVVSFRELLSAPPSALVRDVMHADLVTIADDADQESASQLLRSQGLMALPVVDAEGRMQGIVTFDDIAEVVEEEATEDIQKLGGSAALGAPYLGVGLGRMIRKRAGWLSALFIGELLTASAMTHYEEEIARAVVLATFIPLIISSGGNSGSQASTLVVRALALGEVRLQDWWHVVRREAVSGLVLGGILGALGFVRIALWQAIGGIYGEHWVPLAAAVAVSLVGVVLWGTLAGSMLPLLMHRLGFDPASASAPFVATLVDVTGLVIYFSVAILIGRGTLL